MASRTKGKRARKVQKRKKKPTRFPSDAESVALREAAAMKEKAKVKRLENGASPFFGAFEVSSTQWENPYIVEIRSLTEPLNTCSCQDHHMNRLGTCKHIERVLQFISHRRKRKFRAAAEEGSQRYEMFFDVREHPAQFRMLQPSNRIAAVEKQLGPLFGAEGFLLGTPGEVWPALENRLATLPARARRSVRVSRHSGYWLDRERQRSKLEQLRQRFERDVASGKKSDNPVNLPLYPYQKQGMIHLAFKGRALLADEMGLGKTVQAIAAAELLRRAGQLRRVLVVSPASLKAEWEDQIMKFTGTRAKVVYGTRRTRLRTYSEEHAFILCNYEQIRVDVDDINRLLVPDLVVLDEAQRIKNWPTKTAKTIKRLRSPFAFVLTGTPLENRIEELYSLVEFVDPHVFGSLFRFQRNYMAMGENGDIRPKNLGLLHRTVSTVMLRRRKTDIDEDLPERTDKNFFVSLTSEQKRRYSEYEYEAAKLVSIMKRRPLKKQEFERLQMLLACMRMTCDTPFILDPNCRDCPKRNELEDVLDDVLDDPSAKAIIFSEWVRMLDLVKELLEAKDIEYAEHTGKVAQKERRAQIRKFKSDAACRVFLSSDSGSTGLNLQTANVVINMDLPWNPAKLEQRIARAWRKHQKRSVRVINLVSKGTIEEGMLGKLAYKTALADSVLDGAQFDESLRTKGGRQAFAARVGNLLGGEEPLLTQEEGEAVRGRQPAADLASGLASQFADSVLGIEQDAGTGRSIIVARPGSNIGELRESALGAGEGKAVVITPETKQLLLQLQSMGMLKLSPQLESRYAAEGYTPLAAEPEKGDRLDYAAAGKVWESAQAELKAAQTLGGVGLVDQAAPHMRDVMEKGRGAVAALYGCGPDALPENPRPEHASLLERIDSVAEGPAAPEKMKLGIAVAADIEKTLRNR